ncbi:MAG: SRPBCC family protein [Bacteroides sp.]|nr:SRPBCC family protein [Bacteroides sp.]
MTKFESSVKEIAASQQQVYDKLSDLSNLEGIRNKIPADKIKNLSFDSDSLTINAAPVGEIRLQIIEREAPESIKFEAVQSPLPFNVWIEITPVDEQHCKLKVTLGVEINPFIKGMLQKPLQEGLEKMVEMLASIPY